MRRSSSRHIGIPREPTFWVRRVVSQSQVDIATVRSTTLLDFATLTATAFDELYTIRKVIIAASFQSVIAAGTLAAGDVFNFYWGLALMSPGATAFDPTLAAAADQDADWIAMGKFAGLMTAAPQTQFWGPSSYASPSVGYIDIRSMRKAHQTDRLNWTTKAGAFLTGGAPGTVNTRGDFEVSVLLQRTMKRK